MTRLILSVCLAIAGAAALWAAPSAPQRPVFMPVEDVKPGMVGIGRTVFAGDRIEEFKVNVIGVLRNVTAPQRDLILARLEGGPLATTGVIQGMSGSPVYIDGKLVGAVSYALGSFPKEPLAGITPIAEMITATSQVDAPRPGGSGLDLSWPATPEQVLSAISRLIGATARPVSVRPGVRIDGPASLADLAPQLRPIGAAMVMSGVEASLERELRTTLHAGDTRSSQTTGAQSGAGPLRPGDAVGMALVTGDMEMGATGTVTHVDGAKIYGFGHPFLNLGPTSMPMTRARVFTVLPSLDSSMKVATLGPIIGTMTQDRATAVAGVIGAGPSQMELNVTLRSDRDAERRLQFRVLHDQALTPLFAYVAVLNALAGYERNMGTLTIQTSGDVQFPGGDRVAIDDVFAGDGALSQAAAAATASIGLAATNEFRPALATRMNLTLSVAEKNDSTTIERAWLDTTRPKAGATHTLNVQLRGYRGATETIQMPVTLPVQTTGTLTLLVADAGTLTGLEDRDLRPARPASWPALLTRMNDARRNNRVYVRLIHSAPGTVVAGDTLPALPGSVRSVFDDDKTVGTAPVTKTVIGAWEHRLNRAVRGSREISLNVTTR
jgi:hypothetical protein